MHSIENRIAHVEQVLNPIDKIPFLGCLSGIVRILAGIVELVAGMVFSLIKVIKTKPTTQKQRWDAMKPGFIYALHGMGNILRGSIAALPFVNLLALSIYDKYVGRMNYEQEIMQRNVYPLMTAYKLAPCN